MEIKFLNQPKEIKLGDVLKRRLEEKFDKVYLIAGMAKDTALEDLYEALEVASSDKSEINVLIGIDRKNISKDMLLKILSLGVKLGVHINTDEDKVETRCYVFEKSGGESYIYVTGAKFSSGGLFDNVALVAEIKYSKDDKALFNTSMNSIKSAILADFHEVDKDEVILLAEKGEIVARIKDRKIPKISEMYGSAEDALGETIYDESTSNINLNLSELNDVDIEFEPVIAVGRKLELEVEREMREEKAEKEAELRSVKKKEADLARIYGKVSREKEEKPIIHMSDEIDYSHMSTLIIEAGKIAEKGAEAGEFKIPKMVAENMIDFFGGMDAFKEISDDKGRVRTKKTATFTIIDNKDGSKRSDESIEIILTDRGISLKLDDIAGAIYESDIIRLIKEKDLKYVLEIIRKDTPEYNIWTAYLINTIRGNKRKFGIQ